ncbi:hypothetical protein [Spirosoma rhododendri]|uniref:Uncharacterized protein n=1 Tax=Spirosoma rhododendri TaxID=2728024 RepID=A0A7L5DK07_9BACT|nr:hypothetical protein [Spirosoma rhododendri]QJD78746.1 hypothetical protein HH216_10135 [Spirosoma rhododendri]
MIWTLNKAIAVNTARIFVYTVFMSGDINTIKQCRTRLNRLSRIVSQVRSAQMMHPSLLTSEYGSVTDYLRAHLSTSDYRYFVSLQPTVTPVHVLVAKTA